MHEDFIVAIVKQLQADFCILNPKYAVSHMPRVTEAELTAAVRTAVTQTREAREQILPTEY